MSVVKRCHAINTSNITLDVDSSYSIVNNASGHDLFQAYANLGFEVFEEHHSTSRKEPPAVKHCNSNPATIAILGVIN